MEQINKVELCGTVGAVRNWDIAGRRLYEFSLATNRAFKDRNGNAVIETEWHHVVTWDTGDGRNEGIEQINKGSKVHVYGRISYERFMGSDGTEKYRTRIVSNRISVIDGQEPLEYEM